MSTSLINSALSPTSKPQQQQQQQAEADPFNKYTLHDSPRSTAHFNRPCLNQNSKWRTVLAHLAPPRLLPAPFRSAKPRPIQSIPAAPDSAYAKCSAGSLRATPSTLESTIADADLAFCNSSSLTTDAACTDVEKLLHIFLQTPFSTDITRRTHILSTLCVLCASSQGTADRCVAEGGVETIINLLNISTAQSGLMLPPPSSTVAIVEESEKALLLLQLLTSSSDNGCVTALQHSSSIIATLGKKLLRVSESCTASAIAILTTLCRHNDGHLFRKAVSETAIPSKLVVVLQVASKDSTKRRAGRLLRLLGDVGQEEEQSNITFTSF